MRPRRLLPALPALFALLAVPAAGQVCPPGAQVLASQPQDYTNGFKSDATPNSQIVADQVVVPPGTLVERVTVWGGFGPGNNVSNSFTLIVHEDAAGLPGPAVYTETGVATTLTATGMIFPPPLVPLTEYEATLTLASPALLAGGTYWFEVYNSAAGGDAWFWLTGTLDPQSGVAGGAIAFTAPGASWSVFNPDMALAICGAPGDVGNALCFGDGAGSPCPCGNEAPGSGGCANSTGLGATLGASGSSSVAAGDLVLEGAGLLPNQPGLFFQGDNELNGGNGAPFGDGLRCCGSNVQRIQVVVPNAAGQASSSADVALEGGASAGETKCYQLWYRDPSGGPCGSSFNLTNALRVTWQA